MSERPVVCVMLCCDDMNAAMMGLLETLNLAGCITLYRSDLETGALFDIAGSDREHVERIYRNLQAWHMDAKLVRPEGDDR